MSVYQNPIGGEPFAQPAPVLRGAYGTVPSSLPTPAQAAQVVAVAAGTVAEDGTYTITAPTSGTYILEFGCGVPNTATTGTTLSLTSDKGGTVYYSDTGPGGGTALVPDVALTAGQTVTVTCSLIGGSGSATLLGCWGKLTRTS